MIERFFDELRRSVTGADKATEPRDPDEKLHSQTKADEPFLAALPTIRQIVWRKLFSARQREAPDLVQKIILQLLKWRENNPNKIEEMSADEWQSFAAKTAYHAVNRSLSGDEQLTAPLDEAGEIPGENEISGNTAAEVASLVSVFWQGICQLSLHQRRALLLNSESLLVILRFNGISNQNLSEILELNESELLEIIARLPLSDAQIARLTAARNSESKNRRRFFSQINQKSAARSTRQTAKIN